jgi:transposase
VGSLDLAALGLGTAPAVTGRPAYDPADLLRLYLYGYLHRVRSSRRLEAETHRNLEVIWLVRGVKPDHWTIAAFRREHRGCFAGIFREFNLLCRKLELFGAELIAIDGAKFKAVNSPRRHYTAEQLRELVLQIDARIAEYLAQLEHTDAEQAGAPERPSAPDLSAKLTQLRDRRAHHVALQEALTAAGQTEVSLTDPDSRGQKKVGVGYNAQLAVDAKHHLIAAAAVVPDQNDLAQLHPLAAAAQTALAPQAPAITADAGYHAADQLEKCEAAGIVTFVPVPGGTAGQAPGATVHPKSAFAYDASADQYRCPAGATLSLGYTGTSHGKLRGYYYNVSACGACAQKAACTTSRHRKISRLLNEAVVERAAARVVAHPERVAARKSIVEHLWGTLRHWGHDEFLCRGLDRVRAEFALSALSWNLRRALNVAGTTAILAALRPAG